MKPSKKALDVKSDPYAFIDQIAKTNSVPAPEYAATLKRVDKRIEKEISLLPKP